MAYTGYDHFENDDGIEMASETKAHLATRIDQLLTNPPFDFFVIDRAMGLIEIFRVISEHCSSSPPDNMTGASIPRWRRTIMEAVVDTAQRATDEEHAAAVAERRAAIEETFAKLAVFERNWRESRHWNLTLLPNAALALQKDLNAVIRCPGCDEADLEAQRTVSAGTVVCVLRCPRCGLGAQLEWAD